jgi:type IV pilus assembly protein PilA
MKQRTRGFTVVEVMFVLTIIGILAAIAFPVYQDYRTRVLVTEAIVFLAPAKTAVALYYSTNSVLPSSNDEVGLNEPTSMNSSVVESVEVLPAGIIMATLRHPSLSGHTLTLTPTIAHSIIWTCSSSLPELYLPSSCR